MTNFHFVWTTSCLALASTAAAFRTSFLPRALGSVTTGSGKRWRRERSGMIVPYLPQILARNAHAAMFSDSQAQGPTYLASTERGPGFQSSSTGPTLVVTSKCKVYREAARALLRPDDCVLEVGCQLGAMTAILASRAARVIGVDMERALCSKTGLDAHRRHATAADAGLPDNVALHLADTCDLLALQNICAADADAGPVTVVLLDTTDIFGHDLPLNALSLCRGISRLLAPSLRTIIVRSKALDRVQWQLFTAADVLTAEELRPMLDGLPRIVAARGAVEYRAAAERLLEPGWRALEIGCRSGTLTGLLHAYASKTGGSCAGVDISLSAIEHARLLHPEVAFDVCDAWDVVGLQRAAHQLLGHANAKVTDADGPDMILLNICGLSGAHGELDTFALVRTLLSAFSPTVKAVVVNSLNLQTLASQLRSAFLIARERGTGSDSKNRSVE